MSDMHYPFSRLYRFALSLVLAMTGLSLAGCDQGTSQRHAALATVSGDEVRLNVDQPVLAGLFTDVEGPLPEAAGDPNRATPSGEGAERLRRPVEFAFDSYEVQGSGTAFYAVAKGETIDGHCYTVARRLSTDGDQIGLLSGGAETARAETGEEHTCTGVGCFDCNFVKDGDGEIEGCTCVRGNVNGYCNHSVSSGG